MLEQAAALIVIVFLALLTIAVLASAIVLIHWHVTRKRRLQERHRHIQRIVDEAMKREQRDA